MNATIDRTHDPDLRSWVDTANRADADFPLQNLPFGVFRCTESEPPRVCVAIGDQVLDLHACAERGLLRGLPEDAESACRTGTLNALMGLEPRLRGTLRHRWCSGFRCGHYPR